MPTLACRCCRYLQHLVEDPAVVRIDQITDVLGGNSDAVSRANLGSSGSRGDDDEGTEGRRCPYIGLNAREGLLQPMLLWDAAMARAIDASLRTEPSRLVVHVCGSFHCERRLGIVEVLEAYRPNTRQLVITVYPERDCHTFNTERHTGLGDFVILTDESLARSHDYNA